ncbi:MAG: hypothetical protein Q9174_005873 [Haloplaca sp. 1 TL-2023]
MPESSFKYSDIRAKWHNAVTPLDFDNGQRTVDRARRPGILLSENPDQSLSPTRQRNDPMVKEPSTTAPGVEPSNRGHDSVRQQASIPSIVASSPKEAVNRSSRHKAVASETPIRPSTSAPIGPGWSVKCYVINTTTDDETVEYTGPFDNLAAANREAHCTFNHQKRRLYQDEREEHVLCGQQRFTVPLRKLGWLGGAIVIVYVWRVQDEEQEDGRTKEKKVWKDNDGKAFV